MDFAVSSLVLCNGVALKLDGMILRLAAAEARVQGGSKSQPRQQFAELCCCKQNLPFTHQPPGLGSDSRKDTTLVWDAISKFRHPTCSHWKFLLDQRNYDAVMLAWDLAHLLENMSCFTGNFTSLPGIRCDRWILFCAICVIYHTRHILTILYVIVYIVPCERGGGWWYYGVVDLAGAWLCTL